MTPVSLKQHGDIMQDFRRVHFVGIGGVGMSGIAEVLCNLGYSVSGSDKADNATTRRLAALGARIERGHAGANVADADSTVFGSVGRMVEVKDYPMLARAFILALQQSPERAAQARLVIVGDGPARAACMELLAQAGMAHLAWLPGERHDIAELMQAFDVFVLPSKNEGISNTILEALASGLPVGGDLEYADEVTLGRAFEGRRVVTA